MQKMSKLLWSCVAAFAAVACFGVLDAGAAGRSTISTGGSTMARMPTMPTMSINTIGTNSSAGVNVPSGGGTVTPEPTPTPSSGCVDGGVENSEFTVADCMNSLSVCIQGGALPNGLNDMFNEDMRNSIINGMGICTTQVERCIREVRIDCHRVYDSSVDVWLDFNSRVIQPEYYSFVLRKTGLTPRQAENVCGLLDKNTYGRSFAAISASNNVTSEYNNTVNAYNDQSNVGKDNPRGPIENTTANGNLTGVDGERGHYARWDATNAICKLRVGAYNKDKLITNKWLFGAIGNDKAAEVWQDAGSTFTCNKDLFDFSLLNNTKTAAVVGMGGGTLLGAGIGALLGHGDRKVCQDSKARDKLWKSLLSDSDLKINKFLNNKIDTHSGLTETQCNEIVDLYSLYLRKKVAVETCREIEDNTNVCEFENPETYKTVKFSCKDEFADFKDKYKRNESYTIDNVTFKISEDLFWECAGVCECQFRSLAKGDSAVYCSDVDEECQGKDDAKKELDILGGAFDHFEIDKDVKSNRPTTTLVGAGIGLGAGGVATAITAFVERNNVSCRVGDGLNTVGFGKSFTIDTLKDFYVKWNLNITDTISPTAKVTSCQDWINTCGMYTSASDCNAVEINYQKTGRTAIQHVLSACVMSGSVCIENRPVAVSYGACRADPSRVVRPVVNLVPAAD